MTTGKKTKKEIRAYLTGIERSALYAKMLNRSFERLKNYYKKNPQFVGDARARQGIDESVAGLNELFDELDNYDLVPRSVKFERDKLIEPENFTAERASESDGPEDR